MNIKNNLVPKLRFTEFNEEWDINNLESLSTVKDGTHDSPKYYSMGFPLITSKNLLKNGTIDFKDIKLISKEDFDKINKRSNVDKGDILFGMIGTIGNPVIVDNDDFAIKNVALIKEKDCLKNKFLIYLLNTRNISKQFYKLNAGGTQKFIALNLIRNLEIIFPNLKEQKKIADFLSKIDKKIDLLNQKLNQMNQFKKGLMQQIFSQKLRFEGFNDEWERFTLGKISKIGKGFTPSTSNSDYWDGDIDWLSIADMNQGKYINTTTKKITSEGTKNKPIIKKGTLLMSFKLSIGRLGILNKDMYTNEAICNFQWKNKGILTEYMYYYLNSINIMKYGSQAAKGITLNNDSLSTIPILLPSLEEQKFISDCISKADWKVNLIKNQLTQMEEFKKGLLQQMFV